MPSRIFLAHINWANYYCCGLETVGIHNIDVHIISTIMVIKRVSDTDSFSFYLGQTAIFKEVVILLEVLNLGDGLLPGDKL